MPEQPPTEGPGQRFDWFGISRLKNAVTDALYPGRADEREHLAAQAVARAKLAMEFDQAVIVTDVVGANTITFTRADGTEVAPPYKPAIEDGEAGITSRNLVDLLAGMYVQFGSHDHDALNISETFGLRHLDGVLARIRLGQAFPSEVYARTRPKNDWWSRIGNVLINSRLANEDELADYEGRVQAYRDAVYAQERAEVDGTKPNLLSYDYATVTVGRQQHRVPLRSAEAILACRVIEAIGKVRKEHFRTSGVSSTVWRLMHTSERQLFTDNRAYILGQSEHVVTKHVIETLSALMGKLSIAQRFSPGWFTKLNQPKVTYHQEPPPDQLDINVLVFPDDMALEAKREEAEEITDAHRQYARELLGSLTPGHHQALDAVEAIRILNFIRSRPGYWAIRSELQRDHQFSDKTELDAAHKLETTRLLNRVACALGEGFGPAEESRCIPGISPDIVSAVYGW